MPLCKVKCLDDHDHMYSRYVVKKILSSVAPRWEGDNDLCALSFPREHTIDTEIQAKRNNRRSKGNYWRKHKGQHD